MEPDFNPTEFVHLTEQEQSDLQQLMKYCSDLHPSTHLKKSAKQIMYKLIEHKQGQSSLFNFSDGSMPA